MHKGGWCGILQQLVYLIKINNEIYFQNGARAGKKPQQLYFISVFCNLTPFGKITVKIRVNILSTKPINKLQYFHGVEYEESSGKIENQKISPVFSTCWNCIYKKL